MSAPRRARLAGRAIRSPEAQLLFDRFADLLAHNWPVSGAAASLGKSTQWGKDQLKAMRRKLGHQAR
jgi:hypothetical protein